jgi:hypothetical protein
VTIRKKKEIEFNIIVRIDDASLQRAYECAFEQYGQTQIANRMRQLEQARNGAPNLPDDFEETPTPSIDPDATALVTGINLSCGERIVATWREAGSGRTASFSITKYTLVGAWNRAIALRKQKEIELDIVRRIDDEFLPRAWENLVRRYTEIKASGYKRKRNPKRARPDDQTSPAEIKEGSAPPTKKRRTTQLTLTQFATPPPQPSQ